jgi:hypothetical protein
MDMGRRWTVLLLLVPVGTAVGLAVPATAADHGVRFPTGFLPGPYLPSSVDARTGDAVTFSGSFDKHPLVWDDGAFPTTTSGSSKLLR